MELSHDPYWSESSWFSWAIPERKINGFFYNHFRPNMNCLLGGPAMWDPSGHHPWDVLYFDWQLMRELPAGTYGVDYDKYEFETPWGMSIHTLEPLRRYQLGYARAGFALELVFEAVAEPNILGGNDEARADAFSLHFEQPGRITGTVVLDGEHYEIDCFSIRDGSHGRRHLENPTPGGYTWSTADERSGWHLIAGDTDDSRDTHIWGGYYLRDGVLSPLARGVRRVIERTGPRPSVVEVVAEDELGRELYALGREVTYAEWFLFPDHGQWWTLFEWDYDGHVAAIGEDQEYYGIQQFRRWHRAGPDEWRRR